MTATSNLRELAIELYIAAPIEKVWHAMTERMHEWWCPAPWRIEIIEQDWRAGGRSAMVMHGPDGESIWNEGIFLEVTPGVRFVTTDALTADWQPQGPMMVGIWEIRPEGEGTRYRAAARHWTDEAMEEHKAMGFEQGWSICADQLALLVEESA